MGKNYSIRYFNDLTAEEQDEAIGRLRLEVLNELYRGTKEPLDERVLGALQLARATKVRLEDVHSINDWAYDIAASLAEEATYIPDDGTMVVRL